MPEERIVSAWMPDSVADHERGADDRFGREPLLELAEVQWARGHRVENDGAPVAVLVIRGLDQPEHACDIGRAGIPVERPAQATKDGRHPHLRRRRRDVERLPEAVVGLHAGPGQHSEVEGKGVRPLDDPRLSCAGAWS